jgi:hypothetical protein
MAAMMPMYFLPIIDFSPHTPYFAAINQKQQRQIELGSELDATWRRRLMPSTTAFFSSIA